MASENINSSSITNYELRITGRVGFQTGMPFPAESIPDRESGGTNGWKRPIPLGDCGAINIAFSNVIGVLTILVVAIASISLVVGGIGIANIMLVSVVERTREIGIRKALGATHWAILTQFLIEAIAISMIGGVIGAGGGILIAFGSSLIFKFPFVVSGWSIVIGFGLSTGVGLVAGVIPARNAALLDPIAALRSE